MNMEFKPDALKDLSDCKTSINQDGLQGQLKGRIFDEPILTGNKCEGDLFRDTDLNVVYHFRQFSMVIPDEREQIAPVLYLIPFVSAMVSHEPFEESVNLIDRV